ncbi:MAG: hypothetical protein ACHQIO_21520 [Nevskiales bacterium]
MPTQLACLFLLPLALVACTSQKPAPVEPAATPAPPPAPKAPTTLIVTLQDAQRATAEANAAAMIIAARLAGCWQSSEQTNAPTVALHLGLDPEGAIEAVDVVDKTKFATQADYRAAAKTATSAIFKCSPFALPAGSHESWESLIVLVTPHHA